MKKLVSSLVLMGGMVAGACADTVWPVDVSCFDWIGKPDQVAGLRLGLPCGKNASVTGVDAGVLGWSDSTWGIEVNLFGNFVRDQMGGVQAAACNRDGSLCGVQVGLWNDTATTAEGVQLGLVSQAGVQARGAQLGLVNLTKELQGVELGFVNIAPVANGCQAGGVNLSDKSMVGLQFGLANRTLELQGYQIGLWDDALSVAGYQVGLINQAHKVDGFQIGLINTTAQMHGFQVGIVNVIRESTVPFCALANWRY